MQTFRQYLAFRALIERKHSGDEYRNFIETQWEAHPELQEKVQSWDKWKEEGIE